MTKTTFITLAFMLLQACIATNSDLDKVTNTLHELKYDNEKIFLRLDLIDTNIRSLENATLSKFLHKFMAEEDDGEMYMHLRRMLEDKANELILQMEIDDNYQRLLQVNQSKKRRDTNVELCHNVNDAPNCERDNEHPDMIWTVIQRRIPSPQPLDFYRSWEEYKNGFGYYDGEFYIGNEKLHDLTSSQSVVLRIEMETLDGEFYYAQYKYFYVGNDMWKYNIAVDGYSGNATDALMKHNGRYFSTLDFDNDKNPDSNCAINNMSGWWFADCGYVDLNGPMNTTDNFNYRTGMLWSYKDRVEEKMLELKKVKMMIREKVDPPNNHYDDF